MTLRCGPWRHAPALPAVFLPRPAEGGGAAAAALSAPEDDDRFSDTGRGEAREGPAAPASPVGRLRAHWPYWLATIHHIGLVCALTLSAIDRLSAGSFPGYRAPAAPLAAEPPFARAHSATSAFVRPDRPWARGWIASPRRSPCPPRRCKASSRPPRRRVQGRSRPPSGSWPLTLAVGGRGNTFGTGNG